MRNRMSLTRVLAVAVAVAAVMFFCSSAVAQEHPQERPTAEHPQEKAVEHPQEKSAEHPQEQVAEQPQEHPISLSTQVVTKENLAKAIHQHIANESAKNEGFYLCVDDKTGETLKLSLKKVHEDRLASLGDNTYFACADFETPDGKVYDLDIFMVGKTAGDLEAKEVAIHKEGGVERYTWQESEGVWHKIEVSE